MPDLCDEEGPELDFVFNTMVDCENNDEWCSCTLSEKFIEDSWLCIPCFIKHEAEAYRRHLKRECFEWKTSQGGSRKLIRTTVCLTLPLPDYC
jgi:hypothetical protein